MSIVLSDYYYRQHWYDPPRHPCPGGAAARAQAESRPAALTHAAYTFYIIYICLWDIYRRLLSYRYPAARRPRRPPHPATEILIKLIHYAK